MTNKQYLDYNATAPLRDSVKKVLKQEFGCFYGNPSSVNFYGQKSRNKIENARQFIQSELANDNFDVFFTSGATEANNWALNTFKGNVIISDIEHDSVYYVRDDVLTCKTTSNGIVDLDCLEDLLKTTKHPVLVSIMAANNESGIIQPIKEVIEISRKYGAFVHCDAVQGIGRMNFDWSLLDAFSVSSHKLGGLMGSGALVIRKKSWIMPLLKGGGQEKGFRSGTENLIGIIAFQKALEESIVEDWSCAKKAIFELEKQIKSSFNTVKILGSCEQRLPNTSYIYTPGILGSTQVMRFDLDGYSLSSGSACSSGKLKNSRTLHAMGYDIQCAIRISIDSKISSLLNFFESFKTFLNEKGLK